MISNQYPPAKQLSAYIHSFWTIQMEEEQPEEFRFASDGHPELFFNLSGLSEFSFCDNKTTYATSFGLIGQFYRYSELKLTPGDMILFVKFRPAGLFPLLNDHIPVLNNGIHQWPDLDQLFISLHAFYQMKQDLNGVIAMIENWLLEKIKPFSQFALIDDLTNQLTLNYKKPTHSILDQYGLSRRRLQQVFREKTGLSPKQYQRIQRFRKAMTCLTQTPDRSEFINLLGYYDWSHFSKDMHYYFRLSPDVFISKLYQDRLLINVKS